MIRPLALYIGLRYTRARKQSQFISFVSVISMLGIALGVTSLIAVLSVINASTSTMREETLKHIPHASIAPTADAWPEAASNLSTLARRLSEQEAVLAAAPYVQGEVWLESRGNADFINLRGIEPELEAAVSDRDSAHFISLMEELAAQPDTVILGTRLASRLGLLAGDRVDLTALSSLTARRSGDTRSYRILGVADLGFYANDNAALIGFEEGRNLFARDRAAALPHLRLRVDDVFRARAIATQARQLLPPGEYQLNSWDQTQASLFNALRMEKRLTGFMLLMIVIIGAVNIVSTLVMVVADKSADIAILRTMGARRSTIMGIFMTQGLSAGLVGIVIGALLGILLALQLGTLTGRFEQFMNEWLVPDQVYMISHLRAELQWSDVALVCGGALLICLLATLYPAWRASRIQAAEVLRYE